MDVTPEIAARMKQALEATPFTRRVGVVLEEIREGYVRARVPYGDHLVRSHGMVHGGAIFSVMDVCGGAVAATSVDAFGPGVTNVTISASTQFLGMVRGTDLVCEARTTRAGKSITFVDVEVHANDELVAKGAFVFKTTRHAPRPGDGA